jgi:hypothetical protein
MMLSGMLVAVTAAGRLESQSAPVSLARNPEEIAARWVDQETCSAVTNGSDQQPLVVYVSAFRFGYEASCGSGETGDLLASTPASNAPATFAGAGNDDLWPTEAIPTDLGADTVSYFFQADRTTPRTDDFVLMRQVSGRRAEPVIRNVLPYPGRPFFQYYYRKTDGGRRSTLPAPTSWLPLQHAAVKHGTPADTGAAARIDTLLAVEVNYSITNGRTGAAERVERIDTVMAFASLGLKKRTRPCDGSEPLFSQASYVADRAVTERSCSADW